MKREELEQKIKDIFDDDSYNQPTYELEINSDEIELVIKKMYEHVKVKFIHLDALSKLFDTKDIDLGEKNSYGGCNTCDYGSSYNQTIYISNYKIKIDN